MGNVPGITSESGVAPVTVLARTDAAMHHAPEVTIPSGYTVKAGDALGKVTASGDYTPQKKSAVATAIADTTAATAVVVEQSTGFVAGDVVDFIDGTDNSTELFSGKTIASVDNAANTITLSAALGAGALATEDWVRLATVDGAQVAKRVALDNGTGPCMVRGLIVGLCTESLVHNLDTHNVKTELSAVSLDGGILAVG